MTPINVDQFKQFLDETEFDKKKAMELILGFQRGFDIGYRGPQNRKDLSSNIPLRVGTPVKLWNKVMQEVKENRYGGPFSLKDLPFDNYMQSPIGLVPKTGHKVRLIFHLSYDFGHDFGKRSLNYHTPKEWCTVKYRDMDHVVANCLKLLQLVPQNKKGELYYAKSDCSHAFRILPILVSQRQFW